MSGLAATNFVLNFDQDVRWAMPLRLKPDVVAAICSAGPDASYIRFATEGGRHAIEAGGKTFMLDCREEKTGATICEGHRDWGRGEITEVGVAKLRGDVQTTFAEKQMLAASKQTQSGADLHERILDASCIRIPPEKKIPSLAGIHNRNTVITPMKTLLPAGSMLRSPPVQVTQERPAESRGTSPARKTPPKLTEANGEEVPKATLEEVARMAAAHGKLRFCVMALLSARNFRVTRKLGQDVISLIKGRHDKVPSESTVEMTIKKVSQMSSWGIILTDQARAELIDTVLPQFRSGSWATSSTPIGSPADGTMAKQPVAGAARASGSKLNPQNATGSATQQRVPETKHPEGKKDAALKRKGPDVDGTQKHKKHKRSSKHDKKEGHKDREHDSSRHDSSKHKDKSKNKHKSKDGGKEEQRASGKSTAGRDRDGGGKGGLIKEGSKEEKKLHKESKRDEKKVSKREREKERGSDSKRDRMVEHSEKRASDAAGEKKHRLQHSPEAKSAGLKLSQGTEEESNRQARKQSPAERDHGSKDAAARTQQPSSATQHSGGPEAGSGSRAKSANASDVHAIAGPAPGSTQVHLSPAPAGATENKKIPHSRSASPAAADRAAAPGNRSGSAEASGAPALPSKMSSPIPPKVVPPKVAMEFLEGDGKAKPAWLETADEGAQGRDDGAAEKAEPEAGNAGPDVPVGRGSGGGNDAAADAGVDAGADLLQHDEVEKSRDAVPQDDDDDDDFSVGGLAHAVPSSDGTAGRGSTGPRKLEHGGLPGHDAPFDLRDEVFKPGNAQHVGIKEGRSGTPDGMSEQGYEGELMEEAGDGEADEVQLNAEQVAQYLDDVSQNIGQLCLDKNQLVRDHKVYVWLLREVKEQKTLLQQVSQSAASGAEVVSRHAEALRDFDSNYVVWFQKSKLMSLLYQRLKGVKNAVAAAMKPQQQSSAALPSNMI